MCEEEVMRNGWYGAQAAKGQGAIERWRRQGGWAGSQSRTVPATVFGKIENVSQN